MSDTVDDARQGNAILHATIMAGPRHADCPCPTCQCCCFHNGACVGDCHINGHQFGDEEPDDDDDL